MSETPFGFGLPDRGDSGDSGGQGGSGPGGGPGSGAGGFPFNLTGPDGQPVDLGQALQQLGRMLSWQGGPVNWDLARESARQAVAAEGDPSVSHTERQQVDEAVRLADLWLDAATEFPAATKTVRTWSRAEWIEGTVEGWRGLVEPVAERVAGAMEHAVPAEAAAMAAPLMGMLRQVGVSLWGAQVGQGLGALATEVVGSTDVGLPLTEPGFVVVLPRNVAAFGDGLGIDGADVLLYLTLREVGRHRLFAHAPWLRAHLIGLVETFARGISIDTSRIESSLSSLDPTRPEAIQEAFESGLFEPQQTPEQAAALARLEVALALVEGWLDDVVGQATEGRLASASALRETVRRQRASGGPAEQTFATLVGLELRPRRLRDAAALFGALRASGGPQARDAIWGHPDLLPTAEDLDDPIGYAEASRTPLDLPPAMDDDGEDTTGG